MRPPIIVGLAVDIGELARQAGRGARRRRAARARTGCARRPPRRARRSAPASAASLTASVAAASSTAARVLASRSAAPAFSADQRRLPRRQGAARTSALSRTICSSRAMSASSWAMPLVELGLAGADAAGLLLDLRAGDRQALEGGGGGGLGVAQFRQALRADRLLLGGVHLRRRALADQRGGRRPAPTAPPPPAPWPASSADAAASPRPCGCRPTGS